MRLDNYECDGQLSIFDFIEKPKPIEDHLPCDTCGHDIKGCCDYDYINNHDYCVLGDKWIPKAPEHVPPIHSYLRYGPHTLIPEVREECKAYLKENGVPDWVTWDKLSLPCANCTWYDGQTCCSGKRFTNHLEFGYLICDGFYQSIVERKPSTVGDAFPSMTKPEPQITDDYIRENPTCFYVFGHYLDREQGWHKVPDQLPTFTEWTLIDVVVFGKKTSTAWMEHGKWEAKDWTFRSVDQRRDTETTEILAWKIGGEQQ